MCTLVLWGDGVKLHVGEERGHKREETEKRGAHLHTCKRVCVCRRWICWVFAFFRLTGYEYAIHDVWWDFSECYQMFAECYSFITTNDTFFV